MKKKETLKKALNSVDVLVFSFGAMIGWGWVVSTGNWIQRAGVIGTIIAFLLSGFMIYFVGLVYAELTTAIPENGGAKVFSYRAFGSVVSFICTWSIILSYVGVVCFEACSLPTIIQYIAPDFLRGYLYTIAGFDIYLTWVLLAIISNIVIIYTNIKGIRKAAILQKLLTLIIAIVGVILIVESAFKGNYNNLSGQFFSGDEISSVVENILSISMVAPFFLFGFDVIPQAAEEINIPLKKIGKIIVLSIAMAVVFYSLVVFSVGYSINKIEISRSIHSSGLVTADAMAKLFDSKLMAKVLIIGGMCGIITSWNSFLIGGSRAIMALANSYMVPHIFSRLHKKYNTPYMAIGLIGILSTISVFMGREMLIWISNCASFACCITYFIVSISFVKLRKNEPDLIRPYKIKKYKFVGFMSISLSGLMCIMYLIPGTNCTMIFQEKLILITWIILGLIFFVICKIKYKDKFGCKV